MGELGYLDDPAFELGMLSAQAMRAVRVIVDIGMHLELPIPARERYHPGERWNAEHRAPVRDRAVVLPRGLHEVGGRPLPRPARSGDLATRSASASGSRRAPTRRPRKGAAFDLKAFHSFALDLGGMGLAQLRRELARF